MAFGGVQTNQTPGETGAFPSTIQISALTLDGRIAVFDVAEVDSGALTTDQTPPADTNAIAANFGPGEGNWTQADVDLVQVHIQDPDDAAIPVGGSVVGCVSKALVGGNLVLNFHNKGVGVSGALVIGLNKTE